MSKEMQIDTPTLVPTQTNSPTDELMQIEEMAEVYYKARLKARDTLGSMNEGEEMWYSKAFFEAGYRKQSEGEWGLVVDYGESKKVECSVCEKQFFFMKKGQLNIDRMPYCPHCGAKMKGGE